MVNTVREKLTHPVIDGDGHTIEFIPQVIEFFKEIAGPDLTRDFEASICVDGLPNALAARNAGGGANRIRAPWWTGPTRNTLDRATAMFPKLLYQRLDEIGLDYALLYPTHGMFALGLQQDELRQTACRAFNIYHARLYEEYSDRMTAVAVIPTATPEEAVAELHFAKEVGLKTVLLGGLFSRKRNNRSYIDIIGFDDEQNYDPVWQACEDLGFSPSFHASGMGWGSRTSSSNYVYNHLGHFAAGQEAICRSLFLGGVTRRFPNLRFAFLEGGVGWACNLFSDIVGHWEKRNKEDIQHYDPANLDREKFESLFQEYAPSSFQNKLSDLDRSLRVLSDPAEGKVGQDEFAAIAIENASEIADLFVKPFYFGCEADDGMNPLAFNTKSNPFNSELKAIFSSDIGHWDVPDMKHVLHEAYELVDEEKITEENFKSFVFSNTASMLTANSPDFFKGTRVEEDVLKLQKS
ncbi:MAG: amidohydrolase family protein [Pseudomonadales bacterium]|nr:amidohydrolase family protein [Pseudomonadales bacterium]